MSSDHEQFVERVKAADGDGLIDGDPWKYEARCEREAKERALEEVARLRVCYDDMSKRADVLSDEAQRLNRINLQLSGDFNEQEGNLEFLRTVRRDLEKALEEERKGRAEDVAKLRQEVEEANKVNAALHGKPIDGEAETFRKLWDEERRAKAVEVDRAYRLRDEVSEVRDALQDREARLEALRGEREVLERQHAEEVAKLRAALEVEASYSAQAKAIIESERQVIAARRWKSSTRRPSSGRRASR